MHSISQTFGRHLAVLKDSWPTVRNRIANFVNIFMDFVYNTVSCFTLFKNEQLFTKKSYTRVACRYD